MSDGYSGGAVDTILNTGGPAPVTKQDVVYPLKGGPKTQKLADGTLVSEDDFPYPYADRGAAPPTGATPSAAPAGGRDAVRAAVGQEWADAGYSPAAVQGILKRIDAESGFNVLAIGDGGTSISLYQHHADRAQKLAQSLQQQGITGKSDPVEIARAATRFAIHEMNGGDAIAARHRDELKNATDPAAAYGVFTSSFERPAGSPGSEETNIRSMAFGGFNASASPIIQRWQGEYDRRSKEYDAALLDAKDLRTAAHSALSKWEAESEKPPKNMRDAWSGWGQGAAIFALLGGLIGRHSTAGIAAAGAALQAANAADQRAYDRSYKEWKDHLDRGLKLVELLNGEAREIVGDARKSYDEQIAQLQTLSTMYNLQQHLDPGSVENIEKNLRVQKLHADIIKAQNADTEERLAVKEKDESWLKAHSEADGIVPPSVHNQHVGAAKRERAGTVTRLHQPVEITVTTGDHKVYRKGLAYEDATGQLRWAGTNDVVETPAGGNIDKISTGQPRSAPALFVQKYLQENPDATADEVSHANALFRADASFAAGPEGRNTTALNTLADHLPLFEKYARVLASGNVPAINAALQRLQTETGHPEITNFNIARDFVADEATRVMVPGGSAGALADREAMKKNLLAQMSGAQIGGAGDVIADFVHGKLVALRRQYGRGDKSRESYFNDRILTPEAKRLFDTGAHDEGGTTGDTHMPPPVPTQAATNALRLHPEKRDEFDQLFGHGAAAKVLGE